MAGSPFDVFRRNQKTLMVAVTCMAMFSFIFFDQSTMGSGQLPMTLSVALIALICGGGMWFVGAQRGKGTEYGLGGAAVGAICAFIGLTSVSGDEPLVTSSLGQYTENDMLAMQKNRLIAERFVQSIVDKDVLERDASDFQNGYFGPATPGDLVLKDIFLAEAKRLRIVVDDAAVDRFIRRISDEKLSVDDFRKLIRRLNVDESRLFSVLRDELTANLASRMLRPPVARQGAATMLTPSPAQYWDDFEKLNVKEELRVATLPVVAFVGGLPEPTEAELTTFFRKFRDKPPQPDGTPGFLQAPRVALASLAADFETFEKEVVRPTEDELRLYYEQNKPRFRARNLPEDLMNDVTPGKSAEPASALKPSNTPTAPEIPAKTETPATQTPADTTPKADNVPGTTAPKSETPASESSKPEAPTTPPVTTPESENTVENSSEALSAVAESRLEGSTCDAQETPATSPAATAPPVTPQATETAPVAPANNTPTAVDASVKADQQAGDKPATEAPATVTPSAEKPAGQSPLMIDPTLPSGAVLPGAGGAGIEKDAIQPFEDVRNQIEELILKERAFAAMRNAIGKSVSEIETALRLYPTPDEKGKVDEAKRTSAIAEITARVKEIADRHKLKYEETALLSELDLRAKTAGHIGVALETSLDRNNAQQPVPVHQAAFLIDPFRARLAEDRLVNRDFIYWVLDSKPARPPELTEGAVKDLVIEAWKREKARELAQQRASELVKAAKEGNKSLADLIKDQTITGKPDSPALTLRDTNAFSWMTVESSNPQMDFFKMFMRPALSNVTGVTGAGNEFMKTVFEDLAVGQVGAAPNQDRSIIYLVEVTKRAGLPDTTLRSLDELHAEYLKTAFIPENLMINSPTTYQYLAEPQSMALQQRWFDEYREKYNIKFTDGEVEFIEE